MLQFIVCSWYVLDLSQKFPDKKWNTTVYTLQNFMVAPTLRSQNSPQVFSRLTRREVFLTEKETKSNTLDQKRNFLCIIIPLHAKASTDSQTTLIYKMKEMFKSGPFFAQFLGGNLRHIASKTLSFFP